MREWFADYVSGEIADDALATLEAVLREDFDFRREFIEYMNIDSALDDLAALSDAEIAEVDAIRTHRVDPNPRRTMRLGWRIGAIVGTVAASLVIFMAVWSTTSSPEPVAEMVASIDATLMMGSAKVGDEKGLNAGKYTLEKGLLHLEFAGNVMVYVEAPARFDALSDKRVVLHHGRLSASVPPEGIGFTVETPEAEVIDFGTEFSVEVNSGTSEVHVFDGLVRVQPRGKNDGATVEPVNVRTSQAVKIEGVAEKPIAIELATDRFIRTFEEPKLKYPRVIKRLSPIAYYRMPIRDRGLAAEPPQYSGVVLSGDGRRPPHARGVSNGGSLRVLADSTGRGGRVDTPPPLRTGEFTLAVFVFLEGPAANGTVATNIDGDRGNFAMSLDEQGCLRGTIRNNNSEWVSVSTDAAFPLNTWRHLIMTADGEQLKIFDNGRLVASTPCSTMASSEAGPLWFGTNGEGTGLWNGRIDELAVFDRSLSDDELADLHPAALEEMATGK